MPLVHDALPTSHLQVYQRPGDGAWLAEADTNRDGIYLYDEGGRTIRELRTADTVRKMTAAIARSVLTMGHPDDEITPDNVATLNHGDVDGSFEIVDQGGFVRGRNRVALRSADAIALAQQARDRLARGESAEFGFSPGYIPIRDNTPGTDPKWGAYDRILVDVVAVNHLAVCSDSIALPPARGGNAICALYLDSIPRHPMKRPTTRAEWRAFLTGDAVKARLAAIFPRSAKDASKTRDALSLEELATEVQAAMKDPESLAAVLVHAIVNRGAEVAEITSGDEPMDGEMPPEMGAEMDARIAKALAPLKAQVDALAADKATRDAAQTSATDADLRKVAKDLAVKDAATLSVDALPAAIAVRLGLAHDAIKDAGTLRAVVLGTARARLASPGSLATLGPAPAQDADDFDLTPKGA